MIKISFFEGSRGFGARTAELGPFGRGRCGMVEDQVWWGRTCGYLPPPPPLELDDGKGGNGELSLWWGLTFPGEGVLNDELNPERQKLDSRQNACKTYIGWLSRLGLHLTWSAFHILCQQPRGRLIVPHFWPVRCLFRNVANFKSYSTLLGRGV